MMIHENMEKLKDSHFELLERLYDLDRPSILALPANELEDLLFPEGDSPLWDAMLGFDENNNPLPDTLLAEQICDILRPANIYHP